MSASLTINLKRASKVYHEGVSFIYLYELHIFCIFEHHTKLMYVCCRRRSQVL